MTREDFSKTSDDMMEFFEWFICQWQEKCEERGLIPFHAFTAIFIPQDKFKQWCEGCTNISKNVGKNQSEIMMEILEKSILANNNPSYSKVEQMDCFYKH